VLNIYTKYNIKQRWPLWRKVIRLNKYLQQDLRIKANIGYHLFALQIILNAQLLKWYNLVLSKQANQKVENQITGRESIFKQIDLTSEDFEVISDNYFFNNYKKLILIRTLGIDYLGYNEGFGLRSENSTLQGFRGFFVYFGFFYVLPLFLFWQFQHSIFDVLAMFFLASNAVQSYLWLKKEHFIKVTDEIFEREKIKLTHD